MKLSRLILPAIIMAFCSISSTTVLAASGSTDENLSYSGGYSPWTFPGINIASPSGFGADWGTAAVGVGFQNRAPFTQEADGAMGVALGLGNSKQYVGLEADVSMYSFHNLGQGGLTLKLHRDLPYGFGVAVGGEQVAHWGATDAPRSWFGSVSKVFGLTDREKDWFSALTLTAGVGDGRFLPQASVAANTGVNVFGSAALRVLQPVAVVADWTGENLDLGLSITPLQSWGLFINPAIADITNNSGDGVRFILGVGFGYIFI